MIKRFILFLLFTVVLIALSYLLLNIIDKHLSKLLILAVAILIVTDIVLMGRQFYHITNVPGDKSDSI